MKRDRIEIFKKRWYIAFSLSLMFIGTTLITNFWGIADYHFILPNAATAIISIFILRAIYKGWGNTSIAKMKKVNRNIVALLLLGVGSQIIDIMLTLGTNEILIASYITFGLIMAVINMFV
ncbi:hypothetical protein M1394_01740 [Candidatus Marsarchaeota archaeon]|nr:hypothetical protein [Candidatus Marsarchaeota archaeon]